MPRVYTVKGVGPLARVVELLVVAESPEEAKRLIEEIGVQFVVVSEPKAPVLLEQPAGVGTTNS